MTSPSLTLEGVSLVLPDGRPLFSDITAQFDQQPTGLVGRNGVGKSALARIMAGHLPPSAGRCLRQGSVHYLPQRISPRQYPTVAALAGVQSALAALERIEAGSADPVDFEAVGERWSIRQHLADELDRHGLGQLTPGHPTSSLSGGEIMRAALVGATLRGADMLILDEPTNHLDAPGRHALLEQLRRWPGALLVISHDRGLLQQMSRIVELSGHGLRSYAGNHAFYERCSRQEREQARQQLDQRKLERRRGEQALREQREQQQRRQAHNRQQGRDANQAKILLGRQKERSESTGGKLQARRAATREALSQRVREAAREVENEMPIAMLPPQGQSPATRRVAELRDVELPFVAAATRRIELIVTSRQRIGVTGPNGCGKSTLLKLLAGRTAPLSGQLHRPDTVAWLDQHASLLVPRLGVLEQLQAANPATDEASLRTRLALLGLDASRIMLPSALLSGGERMKAALACALGIEQPASLLLLDEPGNHLDLASLHALESMLRQYRGALLVVSHDEVFLDRLALTHRLHADTEGWRLQPEQRMPPVQA